MADEAIGTLGTEYVMESSGASLSDGDFAACADATFETAQVAGFPMAIFEFDTAAGGFSAAPTDGAVINVYERKFNSDGNQGPVPDSTYKHDYIGSFYVDPADAQQYLSMRAPIHHFGADYYVEWLDGGSGTASIDSGWALRVTPYTFEPGA